MEVVMELPKITFGLIVLNGEPFTRYNLRALYPFAHQIIVAEGASPKAAHVATPDGHSIDGTLDILRRFKAEEDPEDKIIIVTAEDEGHPNGFWPGEKDEQSQAYAKRATGDWLWQVDIDEFYQPQDIVWICSTLLTQPDVWAVSFKQIQFWGGLKWHVDGWYLRHYGGEVFHRLFRWGAGCSYVRHRPPTVLNHEGVDLRRLGWVRGRELAKRGVYLYHYSLVFPAQVQVKTAYYRAVDWGSFKHMDEWRENAFQALRRPFRVHNVYRYPSWLERYTGSHPPQILTMWDDIQNDWLGSPIQLRRTDDIEQLLASFWYCLGRLLLKVSGPIVCGGRQLATRAFRTLPEPIRLCVKAALRGGAL